MAYLSDSLFSKAWSTYSKDFMFLGYLVPNMLWIHTLENEIKELYKRKEC